MLLPLGRERQVQTLVTADRPDSSAASPIKRRGGPFGISFGVSPVSDRLEPPVARGAACENRCGVVGGECQPRVEAWDRPRKASRAPVPAEMSPARGSR